MQKIASNGATVGLEFTEGNAGLAIPATVVSADWMNSVQRELVSLVTAAGLTPLTPLTDTFDQVKQAIQILIANGGTLAPISFAVPNNQAVAAPVTGFPNINRTITLALEFLYSIYRKTDSGGVTETGRGYLFYNAQAAAWQVSKQYVGDESGVDFSLVVDGGNPDLFHLNYVSDNLAGTSYTGVLKITDLKYVQI